MKGGLRGHVNKNDDGESKFHEKYVAFNAATKYAIFGADCRAL